MARGSEYLRPRSSLYQDFYSRDLADDPYFNDPYSLDRDRSSYRTSLDLDVMPRNLNDVGHRPDPGYHRAFGFSYTSGIRDIDEIKSGQRRRLNERRSIEEPQVVPHWVARQDSRQHPRREFLPQQQQRGKSRYDRSPSPQKDFARRKALDLEGPIRPFERRSPPLRKGKNTSMSPGGEYRPHQAPPMRNNSPLEELMRPNLRQAYRPRSSSLESYWGHARPGSDSPDPLGGRNGFEDSTHPSPREQRRSSGVAVQPRKDAGRTKEPFIPQPDYTWHKKKMQPSGRRSSSTYYY